MREPLPSLSARLVRCRLYSVIFVQDYVQLRFDTETGPDEPVLSCFVPPVVVSRAGPVTAAAAGWTDALRSLIGLVVTATSAQPGSGLTIDFGDVALAWHPGTDELVEIAMLGGFRDGAWTVWRPGEGPFGAVRPAS
ncbi:hypothetical protein LX16_1981 [Stackebrandtia albiflava]|uniref:Uncharacterized protein n=1 Tax=Stackebrandtia albiflava TaxID=406432 RepID=A0A562VEJ1_9ACTN|nr:hypothetical protein [Stackebrandtia albiflava]TWJ16254.1 hypothetical protein LX16_1981 [Stackebrandtia albiflava]